MTEYDIQLTIQKAKEKYPYARPVVITDNGGQFISKEFKEFIKEAEYRHVKTAVKHPESNGKVERFNRTIAEECLRIKSPVIFEDYQLYLEDYINFYNTKRLHSALNYLTPEDYMMGRKEEKLRLRELKLSRAEQQRELYWKEHAQAA